MFYAARRRYIINYENFFFISVYVTILKPTFCCCGNSSDDLFAPGSLQKQKLLDNSVL